MRGRGRLWRAGPGSGLAASPAEGGGGAAAAAGLATLEPVGDAVLGMPEPMSFAFSATALAASPALFFSSLAASLKLLLSSFLSWSFLVGEFAMCRLLAVVSLCLFSNVV